MASFFYMRTLPAGHSSETPHRHQAVAPQEPSRYLGGLCNHFRRKINVEYNDFQGLTHFPLGDCVLKTQAAALGFECHAMSDENLKQLQYVLNEHIALFSRRAPMTVIWQAPSATLGLVTLAW